MIIIPNTLPLAGAGPVSPDELRDRVRRGWRCVRFEFCVSFVVATVRRQSPVYLTERWQERYLYGLGYNVVALLLGPWGVPWGVVWTARALWTNLTGGGDVTDAVLARLDRTTEPPPPAHPDARGSGRLRDPRA